MHEKVCPNFRLVLQYCVEICIYDGMVVFFHILSPKTLMNFTIKTMNEENSQPSLERQEFGERPDGGAVSNARRVTL